MKACAECGSKFAPKRRDQRFCSKPCNKRFFRNSSTERCECGNPVRAKGMCSYHYRVATTGRWPESPEAKARRARVSTATRRARLRQAKREPVDRNVVGERDGWVCGICSDAIDPNVPYPSPMSPSLDHVEPLSLGGEHSYANTRIAHLGCNVRRGNRVA